MAAKKPWLRKGWRKLGTSIQRTYPLVRPDGTVLLGAQQGSYIFSLYVSPTKHLVVAGCRRKTIQEYRWHIDQYYSGSVVADQKDTGRYVATALILNEFEARLKAYRKRQKRRGRK